MSTKKIRVAIVGLGFGAEFIPIYKKYPNAELVALCKRNEEKLNEIADAFDIPKRYTSYEDLLADADIDAVHINTPIPNHGEQSIKALKAGKHVEWNVPMATTVEECKQIWALTGKNGKTYNMIANVVYTSEFIYIKELYAKGNWGKVELLKTSHQQEMDGRPTR